MDFGSEASQMLISKNNPGPAIVPEKVFTNTLSHFYNIQRVKGDRVYDQQDEDEKLFRSVFYLKKNAKMSAQPINIFAFFADVACKETVLTI